VSQSRVKILSGWSMPGGSTSHHISLTNLLNDNGIDCTFYGPHDYHLDKCKSGSIGVEFRDNIAPGTRIPILIGNKDLKIDPDDVVISHFIQFPIDPEAVYQGIANPTQAKRHILSLHETNIFPIRHINLQPYDLIQYVSQLQKDWHSIDKASTIIPPVVEKVKINADFLEVNGKTQRMYTGNAGVIGSIDSHKLPHLSIERALQDGFRKVLLFGTITDKDYFDKYVAPHMMNGSAALLNHVDDKSAMYSSIDIVYHSSLRETYGLVEAECRLAGIPFNGPGNNQEILEEEEILKRWTNILK